MARLVSGHGLGVVADDFAPATLAKLLYGLTTEDVRQLKENAHRAARQLSFQESGEELLRMIREALKP
ncbi:hypothetical protein LCC91_03330 [Tepidimonas taiwanensis]|uniref:hypothetical protein n=1 Tax=Tepidimonas taiwanensis TaxID=307486 RepID=UPI001180FC68|nr:hypothetical protein [Tepidimonas taiwanensis]UBQ06149.1 hypothetical protein LCC91_03330 [Tepidimonas taiwanensis]